MSDLILGRKATEEEQKVIDECQKLLAGFIADFLYSAVYLRYQAKIKAFFSNLKK